MFLAQISDDSDPDVVRLFTPNGERAAAQNCLIIARIVLPGLSTSEDLQPVCEAGVPSRAIKLLVRMQTMVRQVRARNYCMGADAYSLSIIPVCADRKRPQLKPFRHRCVCSSQPGLTISRLIAY